MKLWLIPLLLAAVAAALGGCAKPIRSTDGLHAPMASWQVEQLLNSAEPGTIGHAHGGVDRTYSTSRPSRAYVFEGQPSMPNRVQQARALNGETFEIDLSDAEIAEASKAILGDMLGVSYNVDARLSGRLNIRSQGPVTAAVALDLFEAALQQNNAALVISGDVYTVVPVNAGAVEAPLGVAPASAGAEPGHSVRAVQLRHIAASEMAEILKPFAPTGIVRVDAARNVIVLQGSGAQHRAWAETVSTFDVDWLANRSVAMFKLEAMSASAMLSSLNEIMRNENTDAALVRFQVIESNNSLLAVAKTREALNMVRRWVARLENSSRESVRLHSYEMRYANAGEAAALLSKIFAAEIAEAASSGTMAAASPAAPGAMASKAGMSEIAPSNAAAPPSMASLTTTQGASPNPGGVGGGTASTLRIVPNEPSNALLIYATDADFARVRDVLYSIDVPQKQVLVEAAIIEVRLTDELRHGVQYSLNRMLGDIRITGQLNSGDGPQPAAELPGFAVSVSSPVKVIIDALSAITSINVVSSPHLMVLNNQTARLQVGDQIPVATQNAQKTLDNPDVTVNTISFRDTGVIFEVTPRINSAGSVTLLINQEVSSAQKSAQATLTPTISQRRLTSSITVDDGESIVLGGLFSTETQRGGAGIPELSRIPVVGDLFGRKTETLAKTELLVLISPRIVSNNVDARAVTREVTQRMDALRLEEAGYISEQTGARMIVPADRAPAADCRKLDCGPTGWEVDTLGADATSTIRPAAKPRTQARKHVKPYHTTKAANRL